MRTPLVVLSLLAFAACATPPRGAAPEDFAAPDLTAKTVRLSDFRGRVVLVDVWATWCKPCLEALPVYSDLYARRRGDGLVVLGIAEPDGGETSADVRAFLEKRGAAYPVLLDARRRVYDALRVRALPTAFLFDRAGRLRARWSNFDAAIASEELKAVEALLSEPPTK